MTVKSSFRKTPRPSPRVIMDSTESELSWPTTTSEGVATFCCFRPRRVIYPPTIGNTMLPMEAPRKAIKPPPPKPKPKAIDTSKFIALFNPNVPMTPNIARVDSKYIVEGFFFDSLRRDAYVSVREDDAVVPFNTEVNESFIPTDKRKRLMYVGFRYPDGTSLSYVPIRDVILQHRCTAMSGSPSFGKGGRNVSSVYGKDYVYLSIPRVVYYVLVHMAEESFKRRGGGTKSLLPDAEVRGERVWLYNTEMRENSKVEGYSYGRRYAMTVSQAMKEKGRNLEGDALLYMRFCEDLHSGDPEMKLQFRLHRMMVKGVSRY